MSRAIHCRPPVRGARGAGRSEHARRAAGPAQGKANAADADRYGTAGATGPQSAVAVLSATRPSPTLVSSLLPRTPDAARLARDTVGRALAGAGLAADLVHTAELLVSELVTNAVRHADGPSIELSVSREGTLRCSVSDDSPQPPLLRETGSGSEGGRGLTLVDTLALRWGSFPTDRGKTVWFELSCPREGGHA